MLSLPVLGAFAPVSFCRLGIELATRGKSLVHMVTSLPTLPACTHDAALVQNSFDSIRTNPHETGSTKKTVQPLYVEMVVCTTLHALEI